jgi:2-polyprenyl-6-methoxyphenol hydroxylase-like FAD-dependent oxidoreductase
MRIVVVGAGIAGLVAATAAHRGGDRVTVIERSGRGSVAGAAISLFGNALRALDAIPTGTADGAGRVGLGQQVRAIGGTPAGGSLAGLRTPSGRWLVRSRVGGHGRLGAGSEVAVVHRKDLQDVLLQQLPSDVVEFDSICTGVRNQPNGAAVSWRGPSGETIADADLVIAADGLRSPLRRALWPDDPGVRFAGYTGWRGITAAPVPLTCIAETWGRGERFGFASLHDGRVYWYATASGPPGRTTGTDERAEVLARFGSWHDPIPTLIGGTDPDDVLHHDIHDLAGHLGSFVQGRVVLVGDSAHAMTPDLGQGGCQAIEDAVTLCALLRLSESVPEALTTYDTLRRRRTQSLAARARRMGQVGQLRSWLGAGMRDALMRLVPGSTLIRASASVQRWAPPVSDRL